MTNDQHAEILRHLMEILNTAQGAMDAETGTRVDIEYEVHMIRHIIDCCVEKTCPHGYPQTVRCSRCGE